jgi:hypothetical protein
MMEKTMEIETPAPALGADEFEEGDPRRGPFTPEEEAESARFMRDPLRWHRTTGADWLAVRLQHGRGFKQIELAHLFGIGDSTIGRRIRAENWRCPMAESDRRKLARHVWLAGLQRIDPDDPASRASLRATSDWRMRLHEPDYRWKPEAEAKHTINVNRIEDDNRNAAGDGEENVDVDELQRQLDAMLAELDGDETIGRGQAAVAPGEGAATSEPCDGSAPAGVRTACAQEVEPVGEDGAASA